MARAFNTPCVYCITYQKSTTKGEKKNYLSILERFMPSGESGLNGLGCRINLTDSLICA